MPDPVDRARTYLTPPAFLLFKWADGGRVIAWSDDTTIAFRHEVDQAIARLAPRGLPDFPALVLLLAAARPGWIDSAERAGGDLEETFESVHLFTEGFARIWVNDLRAELRRIAAAAPPLPANPDAKAVLAEAVFEDWPNRGTPEVAAAIASAVDAGFEIDPQQTATISQDTFVLFLEEARRIRERLEALPPGAIDLRLRTGLDAVPKAAPLEPPASVGVRTLLTQLLDDRELSGLARLAQNLMAAVHVPRTLAEPEELPLGGYSDISNRGPLDRLLASELAHDDMTLAARIALNEALYLRREAPPRTSAGKRLLLLDAGVRMWGTPRVFGAAIALALAWQGQLAGATADKPASWPGQRREVEAYRAEGERIARVDLGRREGIVAHLEALEAAPHPGAAVAAFVAAVRAAGGASDAVLVTHEDVLADPEFRSALGEIGDELFYVATVGRTGAYRLYAAGGRGRRLVQEATLSLETLFETAGRAMPGAPLLSEAANPSLPVILSVEPFPLLLPHPVDVKRSRYSPRHGVVVETKDGRLMHWRKAGHGARQLTALVPQGPLHWMSIEEEGIVHALAGARPGHRVTMLAADLESGKATSTELQASGYPPVAICRPLSSLFLVFKRCVDVFDLKSGEPGTRIHIAPGLRWQSGRYLCDGKRNWFALAMDGASARLQAVSIARRRKTEPFVALFDRDGMDGPWGVTLHGDVVSTADDGEPYSADALEAPVELIGASHDGHRIILRGPSHGSMVDVLFDLERKTTRPISGDPHAWLEPEVLRITANSQSLRHKFAGIGVSDTGSLALVHDTGFAWTVTLDKGGDLGLVVSQAEKPWTVATRKTGYANQQAGFASQQAGFASFQPTYSPPGTRYALRAAVWKDGSRAYLDSRGMLHLKSVDRALPEITLVLTSGKLAGWSSDGRLFGPAFFTGDRPVVEARVFQEELARFVARVR